MKTLLISFTAIVIYIAAVFLAAHSEPLYGRKDVIRNDLIKSVVAENTDLCKSFVESFNWQNRNLQNQLMLLRAENDELERELKDLRSKRK